MQCDFGINPLPSTVSTDADTNNSTYKGSLLYVEDSSISFQ